MFEVFVWLQLVFDEKKKCWVNVKEGVDLVKQAPPPPPPMEKMTGPSNNGNIFSFGNPGTLANASADGGALAAPGRRLPCKI